MSALLGSLPKCLRQDSNCRFKRSPPHVPQCLLQISGFLETGALTDPLLWGLEDCIGTFRELSSEIREQTNHKIPVKDLSHQEIGMLRQHCLHRYIYLCIRVCACVYRLCFLLGCTCCLFSFEDFQSPIGTTSSKTLRAGAVAGSAPSSDRDRDHRGGIFPYSLLRTSKSYHLKNHTPGRWSTCVVLHCLKPFLKPMIANTETIEFGPQIQGPVVCGFCNTSKPEGS